jgi:hypothetical protein
MYFASTRPTSDLPMSPFSSPMKWMLLIEFFSLLGAHRPEGSQECDCRREV